MLRVMTTTVGMMIVWTIVVGVVVVVQGKHDAIVDVVAC